MGKSIRITLTKEEYLAIFAACALHEVHHDEEDASEEHVKEIKALDRVCAKINRARYGAQR